MLRLCPVCHMVLKSAKWEHGEAVCPRCGAKLLDFTTEQQKDGDDMNKIRDLPKVKTK